MDVHIPKEIYDAWLITKDKDYAIPDPNDHLIEIYEIDSIKDALMLRAEKWDSPEHKLDPQMTKAPLNVQNQNYTDLVESIKSIQKSFGDLKKARKDLKALKENKEIPDVKAIEKKTNSVEEITGKLQKTWLNFMIFVNKMVKLMVNTESAEIQIIKLTDLPDVRLLRFMLSKRIPGIHIDMISLICSYLHSKYLS